MRTCNKLSFAWRDFESGTGIFPVIGTLFKAAETSASRRVSAFNCSLFPPKDHFGENVNQLKAADKSLSFNWHLEITSRAVTCLMTFNPKRTICNLISLASGCSVACFRPSRVTFKSLRNAFSVCGLPKRLALKWLPKNCRRRVWGARRLYADCCRFVNVARSLGANSPFT